MRYLTFTATPVTDEIGDATITTVVTLPLDLSEQGFGGPPVLFEAMRIGLESLFQFGVIRTEFQRPKSAPIGWN